MFFYFMVYKLQKNVRNVKSMSDFKLIGHRGYGPTHILGLDAPLNQKFPENSLPAFQYAVDGGADGIELDVLLSSDGIPVVLHDRHLDKHVAQLPTKLRSTNALDLTYEELSQLDIGGGNHIPTLNQVIDMFLDKEHSPLYINLDVKNPDLVVPVLVAIEQAEALSEHDFVISSYDWELLKKFRQTSDSISLVPAMKSTVLFGEENVKMPGYIPLIDKYDKNLQATLEGLNEEIDFCALDCTFSDLKPELLDIASSMGVGLQISTGNDRITGEEADYDALEILQNTVHNNPDIPFVICKVDEPDKVRRTLGNLMKTTPENGYDASM